MLIKKLSRIFAISALAFVAVLLWNTKSSQADESSKLLNSAAIQKIVKKGTLNVGVKQDVPNFGYYSAKTNTYQGMEIDLAKKIAKKLKVKVNFTAVTPQTREALMDNGTIDMLI
ncbi:MAG: transporter substrate-binding domain-containing protein, partial [Streptococcus vestibularis]|nr:transporter substrate-binding domain-containing protein [Streptococcus vestibularis]